MKIKEEYDLIIDKLADIRNLFDDSDMKAEGHRMEDAVASPYAAALYTENKLKRLIKENLWLYGKLNMISDVIEQGRNETI